MSLAVALLALLIFLAPDPVGAAEVAILQSADLAAYNQAVTGFKAAMPPSMTVVEYDMQGDLARGRKLARKIRGGGAALVLAVGFKAALATTLELPDIPVIFCMVLDSDQHSLTAPNLTGVSMAVPLDRQLTTIQMALPGRTRLGLLYDPEKNGSLVEEARVLAKSMGLDLIARPTRKEKDVPGTLRALLQQVEALWLVPDSTVLTEDSLKFVMGAALDANVPVIGFSSELARNGALIGLSVRYEGAGRQAGLLARKILLDQYRPDSASMPPHQFRLALNLKTAKFLGITLPPEVVRHADELY